MPLFTAEQAGALSDGATFGNTSPGVKGVDWPGETDDVDVAGYALTQGTATGVGSLTDLVTGGGTLTLTGSFTCPDVQEVGIIVPNGVSSTISFGSSGVDPGCAYSGSGFAIECQSGGVVTDVTGDVAGATSGQLIVNSGTWTDFSGTLTYTGDAQGIENYGTWTDFSGTLSYTGAGLGVGNFSTFTDFSGTLTNSGAGTGVNNDSLGVFYDFSGTLTNSGTGHGLDNYGTFTDFSGTLNNSGAGYGVANNSTFTDFSGTLINSGAGWGVSNNLGGTFTNFSGTCLDSGNGTAWTGPAPDDGFAGIVGRPSSQADLTAENIVSGKTILGVVGTWAYPQTTTLAVALRAAVGMSTANLDTQLGALPTASENADAVWDEDTASHTTAGSFGKLIGTTWAALFSGITSMANWLRALTRSSTPDATALSEINDSGGTYAVNTDSLEAGGTTRATIAAYGSGDGDTAVDHNTGGTDNLRYMYGGVGIDNGTIRAYLKTDYDAGVYQSRNQTVTGSDGRWAKPMYLNSGLTYTLTFEKPGVYGVSTKDVPIP